MLIVINGCKTGPQVTGCAVDVGNNGFDCVTYPNTRSFIEFEKGEFLQCVSPSDLEDALKACKNHKVLPITICKLQYDEKRWACEPPSGGTFFMALALADNYFCMSAQDYKRVLERCKPVSSYEEHRTESPESTASPSPLR